MWHGFECHQNTCTLVANANTHGLFHTMDETTYIFVLCQKIDDMNTTSSNL